MTRAYQYDFSRDNPYVYDREDRERKAKTMLAVLRELVADPLDDLDVLDVGSSAGAIDHFLAAHVNRVVTIDIDKPAVAHARRTFSQDNLEFLVADALNVPFAAASFDVVICAHVYEHVSDARQMLKEVIRVLRSGGVCYFAAGNRLTWNEPHYNLPLLSVLPRSLAHWYIRLAGDAEHYHEKHLSYWGLKRLVAGFVTSDVTVRLIDEPERFDTTYMLPPGSWKARLARFVAHRAYWLLPGYIWLLKKP